MAGKRDCDWHLRACCRCSACMPGGYISSGQACAEGRRQGQAGCCRSRKQLAEGQLFKAWSRLQEPAQRRLASGAAQASRPRPHGFHTLPCSSAAMAQPLQAGQGGCAGPVYASSQVEWRTAGQAEAAEGGPDGGGEQPVKGLQAGRTGAAGRRVGTGQRDLPTKQGTLQVLHRQASEAQAAAQGEDEEAKRMHAGCDCCPTLLAVPTTVARAANASSHTPPAA